MIRWQSFLPWQTQEFATTGIDLGGGRILPAEEVLDSHARRLATRQVDGQVGRNLSTAIHALAPTLAPLTDIADKVAETSPATRPASKFRGDLQQALEVTHRQHKAQRVLGIRQVVKERAWWQSPWVMVGALLLVVIAAIFYQRRGHQPVDRQSNTKN